MLFKCVLGLQGIINVRNRAKCRLCNDIIESTHVHDYRTCSCGEISVDGGGEYQRFSANDVNNFISLDYDDKEIHFSKEPGSYLKVPYKEPVQIDTPKSPIEIAIQTLINHGVTPEEYAEAYSGRKNK